MITNCLQCEDLRNENKQLRTENESMWTALDRACHLIESGKESNPQNIAKIIRLFLAVAGKEASA